MALYPESGYQSGIKTPSGVRIRGSIKPGYETVLTHEALAFVADLVRTFRPVVQSNLALRVLDQAKYDAGGHPGFDFRTKALREEDWTCAPMPAVIQDRRVEITGPVDRKMVINAMNSGAKVFMADFEDSLAPTWSNLVEGHMNLRDAVNGNIRYEDPRSKKVYAVTSPNPAILFVRPRGWHLPEAHFEVDGQPIPGCLMDFGLYFFHNQAAFRAKHGGAGPFFYLPKMQHSREAAVWNAVFERAQDALGVPRGSIKATVLIETLPAVFQMHEILYELRQHSAGLNCGRWDYIFSFIKTFRNHPELVIPDRTQVGMTQHFLSSYAQLLIQTCHRRGVHAMGGMAAQIPVKNDPNANEVASAKVRADKLREVLAGHDGTWAAHPGLIPLVYEVFDAHMPTPNQLYRLRDDVMVSEADLLAMPVGTRTLDGLRLNLSVGVQYTAAWLTGTGSVPLHNLMEDAATAEISRVQVWQWLRHGAILDGEQAPVRVTRDLVDRILHEEVTLLERQLGPQRFAAGRYQEAAHLFGEQCTAKELDDFLTLEAYKRLAEVRPNSRL